MIHSNEREVDFNKYCRICTNAGSDEHWPICDECLDHPINEGTDRPVGYKAKGGR